MKWKQALAFAGCMLWAAAAQADPGDFSLQGKLGPSFNLHHLENQVKFGTEFDYELEFGFTFNLGAFIGGGADVFVFQMLPAIKYNVLYFYPAVLYLGYGVGFGTYDRESALAMRALSGINLPLGRRWDLCSDLNLFFAPYGTGYTPTTLDWLIGMRYKFN